MSLLVLTAVCAMIAAARGRPALEPLAALVLGGALACGGASALNHVLDRDIDRLMGPRTASRPVAAGRISPRRATLFGLLLSALSFAVLTAFANLLTAALALSGGAFYVVVYTLCLKRTTTQNIVIGGAGGAIPCAGRMGRGERTARPGRRPPVRDRAAVDAAALLGAGAAPLRHYAAAGVPMMPVVRGPQRTARQVLAYTVVLVAATLVPGLTGTFGAVYVSCAAVSSVRVFCRLAWRLWRERSPANAGLLFHYSLLYLALLFAAVAIDAAVR